MKPVIKSSEELSKKQMKKRSAILDAAVHIFARKGFHRTKIADVARMAKVADGTVYLYFSNKDDLLMRAFEEMFDKKLKSIQEIVLLEDTPMKRFVKFIDLHVDLFTENPYVVRFMAFELRQSPEFYEQYPDYWPYRKYMEFLENLVRDAIGSSDYRNVDAEALCYTIFGAVDFVLTQWMVRKKTFSLQEMKDKIMDIIRFGIRNPIQA